VEQELRRRCDDYLTVFNRGQVAEIMSFAAPKRGEEAAFQRFVQDMQERRVDRISLLAAGLETGDVESIAVAAVEVEPLAIEPLSRSDR